MAPCVHEAGHGVIGHLVGARVANLRVEARGVGSGLSLIAADDPQTSVLVGVAGLPAEQRYCDMVGDCPADRAPVHSAHDDDERAWAAAQEACPGDKAAASVFLADSRERVDALVVENWDRIVRVARALFDSPDGLLRHQRFIELMEEPG
jgi:hypothetical protein